MNKLGEIYNRKLHEALATSKKPGARFRPKTAPTDIRPGSWYDQQRQQQQKDAQNRPAQAKKQVQQRYQGAQAQQQHQQPQQQAQQQQQTQAQGTPSGFEQQVQRFVEIAQKDQFSKQQILSILNNVLKQKGGAAKVPGA